VEKNNMGSEVILSLVHVHGYKKLIRYHSNAENTARMEKNGEYGVVSHNSSKNKGVSNMRHFLNTTKTVVIRSKVLLAEMDNFIQEKSGNNNWKWIKGGGDDSFDDTVDAFNWCLLPLHAQLVETYFIIDEFNKYGKPVNILREIHKSDHRKDSLGMPINDKSVNPCIYTNGYSEHYVEPAFDLEWLQNF
jgi:hypothetical protein